MSLFPDEPDEVVRKFCSKCQQSLPIEQFSNSSGGNYSRPECQRCAKKLGKVRRHLKKITPRPGKDYVCPICERTEDQVRGLGGKKVGAWCIDHDHNTDTVRGHLCHDCNRALGNFKDSRVLLQRALEYLRSYNDTV